MLRAITLAAVLAVSAWTTVSAEEEKEVSMKAADVPQAVQDAAKHEGGKILRWEKEGQNYEAVIAKKGKERGIEISPDGKVVSRHNEKKEHKEKGEEH
ncbi:MAG TPA: hypothetical protein VH207_04360 [Chthoniobacterales bacterium]|nr:hypothetical protein [Chthoniobacterales bacterium]